jgi:hypothetical protein
MGDKGAFKSTEHGDRAFTKDKFTYGLDQPMPPVYTKITFLFNTILTSTIIRKKTTKGQI